MTAEVDTGAPNWLRELEEKRERRLKARLGHEAGAGSPCLECKDGCPGLDLHFWRKICKNCRCGKENHDVQDDDVYGWVQTALLGSKPKKPQKIILPGKNTEVELEWAPKGSKEAVDAYLKDLPPELLPIKGSSAAQERKQLLQKQIPVHDVDPTLCHALTEQETQQMNDYVNHLKENSVGVGQLTHISRSTPANAQVISTRIPGLVPAFENMNLQMKMLGSNLERNLQNLSLNEPVYGNVPSKHDYENIDAFGKHKLEASLEEIERLQKCDEVNHNPAQAQYAMLLDAASVPLKDKSGNPIKAKIDVYANPIFDAGVIDRIGGGKAEYAILLDKNSAPIFNEEGVPFTNKVKQVKSSEVIVDKFGNKITPHFAMLLDKNHVPVKTLQGSPVRVNLDVFGAPILERSLIELVAQTQPEFACFLDKNGSPVIDKFNKPVVYDLNQLKPTASGDVKQEEPKYAILLDKNHEAIGANGSLIVANLDPYGCPVISDAIMRQLNRVQPQYSILLDTNRAPILDKHARPVEHSLNTFTEPIFDKFGNEIKPQFGLLLDKNEVPIKDKLGSPIKVGLDPFGRPIIDAGVVQKVGNTRPEFVMFLDRNGAHILDKYGSPIKNVVGINAEPALGKTGILVDKNEVPIRDKNGDVINVLFDSLGKPVVDQSVLGNGPQYALLLDGKGMPVVDKYGNAVKEVLSNDNQPSYGLLLDNDETPVVDKAGKPITVHLDKLGNAIIDNSVLDRIKNQKPKYVLPLDYKGAPMVNQPKEILTRAPIYDKFGNEIKPKFGLLLDGNDSPITNAALDPLRRPVIPDNINVIPKTVALLDHNKTPILDKYGNAIKDPVSKYTTDKEPMYDKFGNHITPKSGLLLDKKEGQIKDATGSPIKVHLDNLGRPIIDESVVERLANQNPEFVLLLDRNGAPIMDKFGSPIKDYIPEDFKEDVKQPLLDKYGNPIDIDNATLLDPKGRPILDEYGVPIQVKIDPFGRPILRDITQPLQMDLDKATLIDKQGIPITDENNVPVSVNLDKDGRVVLHKTGLPIFDASGVQLTQKLTTFSPQARYEIPENTINPTQVNIGIIKDIAYPEYKEPDNKIPPPPPASQEGYDNYDPIPECHRCKKIFEDNALVIQIERSEALWHASCFKCAGCNQNLADLLYFYHKESDDIYCGRDFAKIRGIPRCNACDELIFVKEYCLAENETYHVKHFCCFECDTPLAGQQYLIESNQPLCFGCYEKLKADKCTVCKEIIKPDEQGAALNGSHFHADDVCFACKTCKKPLLGHKFLFRNSKLYCSGPCFGADQSK